LLSVGAAAVLAAGVAMAVPASAAPVYLAAVVPDVGETAFGPTDVPIKPLGVGRLLRPSWR
jgi:hypothetical protein